MNQLVNLLEYLEERHPPFVHGEILPSHLMIKADGVPCLIGFGLAPRLELRPYLELPGQKVPEAAPPGKKRSGKSGSLDAVGAGNDIYGLGASLHALLTGRDVFVGADEIERPFPGVRDLAPRVSVGIAELVNRAVASDPQRRYPSAVAMQATLAPLLGVSRPLPAAPPPGEADGTLGRWAWYMGAALVAAVIAVAVYLAVHKSTNTAVTPTPTPAPTSPLKPGLPPPAHTLPVADAFIRASSIWPDTSAVFRRGAALWVDNTAGGVPIKAARINYSTGQDGFTLRATLRLESGPPTAAYGLVAADRPLSPWEDVALMIRGDGDWSVVRNHAGHATTLVPWRQALQLRLGHNSPNELQLALLPGTGKGHGTFVVTINGQRMSALIPAWSAAPTGRIGIMAAPGARVVCDGIRVDPLNVAAPTVEDHFLDNRLAWSPGASGAVTPLLRNSVLQLQAGAHRPWAEASTSAYGTLAHQTSFDEEAVLAWGNGNGAAAAAGLVFARITPPKPKPHSKTHIAPVALAALVDVTGHVRVVELAAKRVVMVLGPVFSPRVRVGYGLNELDVTVTRKAELLQVRITVNGGAPISFATGKQGLVLATGIAATGTATSVKAAAFKLYL